MNERTETTDAGGDELLFDLMEHFTQQMQAGKTVEVEAYVEKYPQHVARLRKMSSTLQALAYLGRFSGDATSPHQAHPDDETTVAGTTLGDYRVIREIGRGGMGVVFEAKQLSLDRQVALKVLPFAAVLDKRQLKRFQVEAQAAAQLHHTNIVPVFAVGCERGVHYYAMQLIEGKTLAEIVGNLRQFEGLDAQTDDTEADGQIVNALLSGQLSRPAGSVGREVSATTSPEKGVTGTPLSGTVRDIQAAISTERSAKRAVYFRGIAQLGVQVAEALHHAHQQGVVHRDIKPSNLILDAGGTIWVTDFGLARVETDGGLTMTGDILGTLRYMSPEQVLAKRVIVDHRTDVYSLGATLYEMLTLRSAYSGDCRKELLRQIAFEDPRPPRRLNRAIPQELETIVSKAMAKNPAERYETAQELADDLRRFLEDKPIHARRPTQRQRLAKWSRRHRPLVWSMMGAAAIVLVVVALGAVVMAGKEREGRRAAENAREREAALRKGAQEMGKRVTGMLASTQMDWAQALCEKGEIARGMLWFARCLEIAPEDHTELRLAIRANLAAWNPYLHSLRMRVKYPGQVQAVSFSANGSRILAGGSDETVQIWDAVTGQPIGEPLKHTSTVRDLAVSPDGERIATACDDGTVRIWDASKWKPIGKPLEHDEDVHAVTYSRDGSRLMSCCADGTIRLWDATELQPIGEPINRGRAWAIAHTSAGFRAAIKVEENRNQLWDVDRGEPIGPPAENTWNPAAISPDGSKYMSRIMGALFGIWEGKTGQQISPTMRQGGIVYVAEFSPDGSRIVAGGNTRAAVIWDVINGEPVGPPLRQQSAVLALDYSTDGRHLLMGSADGSVRLWDVALGNSSGERLKHENRILAAAFSVDGLRILTDHDGMAQLRDVTGEPVGKPFRHDRKMGRMVFSPDGSMVLTKVWGGWIHEVATGEPVGPQLPDPTYGVAFSPDSSRVVLGSHNHGADIWDVRTGKQIGNLPHHGQPVSGVAFSPDGSRILTGSYDGTTRLWDAVSLLPVGNAIVHQSEIKGLAYSSDGSRIAVGFADGTVRLWDPSTLKPVGVPLQHQEIVNSVTFSPNGSRLLTCSLDLTARLWDVATLKPIGPPMKHGGSWSRGSFRHDGGQLMIRSSDGSRLWDSPGILEGTPEQIKHWTQVVTGLELDAAGGIIVLDDPTWQKRCEQLEALGGTPEVVPDASGKPSTDR